MTKTQRKSKKRIVRKARKTVIKRKGPELRNYLLEA